MFATISGSSGTWRRVRKCRLQRVPVVRRRDRAKLRQGIAVNFKGATHDSKSLAATQARLVCNHQCVRWRSQGWPTTSTVSDLQRAAVVHLARILSAETRGPREFAGDSLSPGPDCTRPMFGRFPGEEQGRGGKDVLRTNNPRQNDADPLGNRKLGSLPRVGRFCVRRRGRLPDRRRGHGHFGRGA